MHLSVALARSDQERHGEGARRAYLAQVVCVVSSVRNTCPRFFKSRFLSHTGSQDLYGFTRAQQLDPSRIILPLQGRTVCYGSRRR